jgi:hypothetical protein
MAKRGFGGSRTLRFAGSPPTLLAGVETVPEPPFTAVILPEDAMLMGGRVLKRWRWFGGLLFSDSRQNSFQLNRDTDHTYVLYKIGEESEVPTCIHI